MVTIDPMIKYIAVLKIFQISSIETTKTSKKRLKLTRTLKEKRGGFLS